MNDATDDLFPIEIDHDETTPMGKRPIRPARRCTPACTRQQPWSRRRHSKHQSRRRCRLPATDRTAARRRSTWASRSRDERPQLASDLFERLDATLAQKIVVDQNIMPVSREQYRRLAATLHHAQEDAGIKVVMVASAVVGEGQDAHRGEPGADVQRVLPANRPAHRRRLPPAGAPRRVQHRRAVGPERRADGGRRAEAAALPGVAAADDSAGGPSQLRSDGGSDVQSHAPRDRGSARTRSTG